MFSAKRTPTTTTSQTPARTSAWTTRPDVSMPRSSARAPRSLLRAAQHARFGGRVLLVGELPARVQVGELLQARRQVERALDLPTGLRRAPALKPLGELRAGVRQDRWAGRVRELDRRLPAHPLDPRGDET